MVKKYVNTNINNEMENIKKYAKIIFNGLVLLLAILFLINYFKACCHVPDAGKMVDPIHDKQVVLNHEIKKSDSLTDSRETRLEAGKDTIKVVEIRYKTKIVEIIKLAPDTCNPYLIAMINGAGVLDSAKSVYILRQDSSIQDYKRQTVNLKEFIKLDSTDKAQAKKDFEKQLNASNWKWFWKGYRWGFGTGAVATQGANSGIRMIKP